MKVLEFSPDGGSVTVRLSAEECDLIADGTEDNSPRVISSASIAGALSMGFRAAHTLLYLNSHP